MVAVGTAVAAMTAVSSQILVAVGPRGGSAWPGAWRWPWGPSRSLPGAAADVRVGLGFLAGEVTALVLVTAFAVLRGPTGSGARRVAGDGGPR